MMADDDQVITIENPDNSFRAFTVGGLIVSHDALADALEALIRDIERYERVRPLGFYRFDLDSARAALKAAGRGQ